MRTRHLIIHALLVSLFFCHLSIGPALAQYEDAPSAEEMKQMMQEMREDIRKQMQEDPELRKQMEQAGTMDMLDNGEKAMEVGMKLNECISSKISPEQMQKMQAEGLEFAKQIENLCKSGQQSAAMALAERQGKMMMESPEGKGMRECYEKYEDEIRETTLPQSASLGFIYNPANDERVDICEGYN